MAGTVSTLRIARFGLFWILLMTTIAVPQLFQSGGWKVLFKQGGSFYVTDHPT